ncbi:histidine phosphotransferase ChpT [Bartonella sp. WD16.2]|uniref:histidine phosphotransferase ChpT n=1 Tax=Bartonella sp. WD16.2 TaxID=1933904 RepID=UPI00099A6534|nr:histidine phosphotransferase family protein [Bartonella sp. WD16.2]AQX20095.1 histidine phosphotransferase ChpT [Bartonella sp. WD16.2]
MMSAVSLKFADLTALLCSRICHDLISPIGAIQNAMELYDEGGVEEDALQLVRSSVSKASAYLQFFRLAFGAAGSVDSQIDTRFAEQVAQQYMEEEKTILKWQAPTLLLPKNEIKLLLNLLLVANTITSRGGEIVVTIAQDINTRSFQFKICGQVLRIPSHFIELYNKKAPEETIDAHAIQFYYTVLLAEITTMTINIHETDSHVILESIKKL